MVLKRNQIEANNLNLEKLYMNYPYKYLRNDFNTLLFNKN